MLFNDQFGLFLNCSYYKIGQCTKTTQLSS